MISRLGMIGSPLLHSDVGFDCSVTYKPAREPQSLLPLDHHRPWSKILPMKLPGWRPQAMIRTLRGSALSAAALRFIETLTELLHVKRQTRRGDLLDVPMICAATPAHHV
jgi:hypothetical protein